MGALQTFGAGGPILIVLAVMSVLSLAAIIVKTAQLAPVLRGDGSRTAALAQWAGGDRLGAMAALGPGKAPADRVLLSAMQALDKGHGGAALISALTQRGNAEYTRMTSLIRTLELTAMISPLLGLLGTVLGMIQSFQELEMAQGSANASVLAGGIWEALLTTAAGLLVAIPAAVGASLLSSRADAGAQRIEAAVSALMLIEDGPAAG